MIFVLKTANKVGAKNTVVPVRNVLMTMKIVPILVILYAPMNVTPVYNVNYNSTLVMTPAGGAGVTNTATPVTNAKPTKTDLRSAHSRVTQAARKSVAMTAQCVFFC